MPSGYSQLTPRAGDLPNGLPSLVTFVSSLKGDLDALASNIASTDGRRLVITMGNEAADLDSMVTAVTYSYWRHLADLQSGEALTTVYLPLINIPEQDFAIRPECVRVLTETGLIQSDALVFTDTPALQGLFQQLKGQPDAVSAEALQVILVDHPKPIKEQKFLTKYVGGILDHHGDEKVAPNASPRWFSKVGSATSLTSLEGYRLLGGTGHASADNQPAEASVDKTANGGEGASDLQTSQLDGSWAAVIGTQPNLFNMLLAPILTDTADLKSKQTKPLDLEAATLLWDVRPDLVRMLPPVPAANEDEALDMAKRGVSYPTRLPAACNQAGVSVDDCREQYFTAWFEDIRRARQAIELLDGQAFLRKDYKQWTLGGYEVGVSSVIWPFDKWIGRDGIPGFEQAFKSFYTQRRLDLLIIMTMFTPPAGGKLQREILVYSPALQANRENPQHHADFTQMLVDLRKSDLKLVPYGQETAKPRPVCYISPRHAAVYTGGSLESSGYIMFSQLNADASRKQVRPLVEESLVRIQESRSAGHGASPQ
ncbi:Exopolyphosphatase [Tieghemiomyces parasiticus]|uniref:Exopolyphosphatase n=1 Tax=Tieghemiomyces parasiticus TaxID=78921 RepID=A0A9W8AL20_9FUNG|nr:Exopolyphosphatase [Tieghemiomyces parasiticus]